MANTDTKWFKEFPGAITVCDPQGIILEMNDKAAEQFGKEGGYALIGKNLLDCHPEPARSQLASMLENRTPNTYTILKNGMKKLVYQTPLMNDGHYEGFLELVLEIPLQMPHFHRS